METESSLILFSILDLYSQLPTLFLADIDAVIAFNILSIIALLVCSGLISASEVAFFSMGHQDKITLESDNSASAKYILDLLAIPRFLLSTILIANNIINIAIVLISNVVLKNFIPPSFDPIAHFLITVVLVTFVILLFGEVAPKVYANQNNMFVARLMSRPLKVLVKVFFPLSWPLVNSTKLVENRLRSRVNQNPISQEDIASAIELTVRAEKNKYAEQEAGMLKGIVRFGNTSAAEIMKPRLQVVAVDIEASFQEVVKIFRAETYSRIPVYEDDLDNVKGIIHAKDILEYLGKDENIDWHNLIRPPFMIPEMKKIDDLFHDFQEKRTHMAIVVDEYGGTRGLVTMEDVLEEIVGEIQDEFDEPEEKNYKKIDDYTYDFDGSTSILDICRILDLSADYFDDMRESAETLAGLILVLKGTIPTINTPIECKNYTLITRAASDRRIEKVRIVIPRENNVGVVSGAMGR